jgi:hypothetical protein
VCPHIASLHQPPSGGRHRSQILNRGRELDLCAHDGIRVIDERTG